MTDSILELELDTLLQGTRENIVVTDGEGIVLRASPNCDAIYGTEPGYFIGKSVYELEREQILCPSVTALVLKRRAKAQIMQRTRAGRLVLATGTPVFDREGHIVRVVSSSYDLTDIELLREEYQRLQARVIGLPTGHPPMRLPAQPEGTGDLAFRSAVMRDVVELILRVAGSDATVLFLGESGVGKTALARYLHAGSKRSGGRFVEVNCSAIPESLFESEMFGHEAGSFTGASRQPKPGLIELADKGTLFLDEIGDLPLAMQAKLLKVLEDRNVMRVGGTVERRIDFRVVASTNRNLKEWVDQGKFRSDLYYRLNVFPITVPPLRLRTEDIPILVEHSLERLNARNGRLKHLAPGSLECLLAYPWPGNVRELKNVVERLWLASTTERIAVTAADLGDGNAAMAEAPPMPARSAASAQESLPQALKDLECRLLIEARARCKTTYEMAAYLGISQPSVVRKLKRYGLDSSINRDSLINRASTE